MLPEKHPDEDARIAELHRLGILDTEAEKRFDDLTALAAQICETPTALVSLVDTDRQWFKARLGMELCETGLESSVCAHTILGDAPLVISDTTADARTADNPLTTGEDHMRFYAGVPLVSTAGVPLGSLCVIDVVPRTLTPSQLSSLERLAGQAVSQLELCDALKKSSDARQSLEQREGELHAAIERANVLHDEIDHRVKNSLSQVAALLRVQGTQSDEPEVKAALDVAQRRVATIASVHRELNRTASDREVNLADYVANLADDLRGVLPPGVTLEHYVPPITVGTRHATPLAIVINEGVANAVKYAFGGRATGKIAIKGRTDGPHMVFEIADNGNGLADEEPRAGLGTRILAAAAQSLNAEPEYPAVDCGHTVRLKIPLATLETL